MFSESVEAVGLEFILLLVVGFGGIWNLVMLYLIVLAKPNIGSTYEKKMSSRARTAHIKIIWSSVSTSWSSRTELGFQGCCSNKSWAGEVWHWRSLPCVHTSLYPESSCYSLDVNDMSRTFAKSYSMILDEIKETSRMFELVKFRHENRLSNGEAHRLARSAASSSLGCQVWLMEPLGGLCI
jgi:hypothetical protein